MKGHWSGATKAPAVTRRPCPLRCGAHVDQYREPHGHVVNLDTHPPSVDVDLTAEHLRHQLYEYLGPRIGWNQKFQPTRGWRELRLIHRCAPDTPPTKRTRASTRRRTP